MKKGQLRDADTVRQRSKFIKLYLLARYGDTYFIVQQCDHTVSCTTPSMYQNVLDRVHVAVLGGHANAETKQGQALGVTIRLRLGLRLRLRL